MRLLSKIRVQRLALLIGDAGAACVCLSGGSVEAYRVFDGAPEQNIEAVRDWLAQHPTIPTVILFDILGQSYMRERVPAVNLFDRGKIVARKLEVMFPGSLLSGGLRLGRATGDIRGFDYLFAAIADSPEVSSWLEMLADIENPIDDARLVPVEASGFVDHLFDQPEADSQPATNWRILITHQRTGGVRQVVTHNGKLAMTRLTSTSLNLSEPDAFGPFIKQEISATIDYITRLGFDRNKGLDAVFVGAPNICAAVEQASLPVRHLWTKTPTIAGEAAGIEGAEDETNHYADLLLAAAGGRRILATMSVWPAARRMRRLSDVSQSALTRVLAAASLAASIYAASLGWSIFSLSSELESVEAESAMTQRRYNAEISKLDEGRVPLSQVRDALSVHKQLGAADLGLDGLLVRLDTVIGEKLQLKAILMEFDRTAPSLSNRRPGRHGIRNDSDLLETASRQRGRLLFVVDLESFEIPENAIAETERLARRLGEQFPLMRASIVRQPLQIQPEDTFLVRFGETGRQFEGLERVAEIQLTGDLE